MDANPSAPQDTAAERAALTATQTSSLTMAVQLGTSATSQGWMMTLAYVPFGLIMMIWAAYPAAIGTGLPLFDTVVGLAITAVGLVGSIGMGAVTLRLQRQAEYWRRTAQEVEGTLSGKMDLLKRELALLNGEAIMVGGERMRLSSAERPSKLTAFHVFYGMFVLAFSFLLMANFLRFGRVL